MISLGQIRDTIMGTMGRIVGIAIALIILALIGAMAILGTQNSANLESATNTISQFLPIVGIAVAVGVTIAALKMAD